jgi:hypothetical protein
MNYGKRDALQTVQVRCRLAEYSRRNRDGVFFSGLELKLSRSADLLDVFGKTNKTAKLKLAASDLLVLHLG